MNYEGSDTDILIFRRTGHSQEVVMEESHSGHRQGRREFHLSVGIVPATLAVELPTRRKCVQKVAGRHDEGLEGERDVIVPAEQSNHGGKMPSCRDSSHCQSVGINVEFLCLLIANLGQG